MNSDAVTGYRLSNPWLAAPQSPPSGGRLLYSFVCNALGLPTDFENPCKRSTCLRTLLSGRRGRGSGWTPDGRALAYVRNTTGRTQNVYMQPLAGGAEIQLTHFDSEPAVVQAFAWSRDGKKLAITRARYND